MANVGSNVVIKMEADASQVDVGMKRAARATKNYEKTTQKANQQLRFMRGGLGQVGHQIQDVAVQLQMGQNAMLVFGQQGSQIVSLFGPGGAMIGALLAVGAAITGSLMPSLFGATKAQKELKEANNSLIDSFDDLHPAQQAFARVLANEKIQEYKDELEKLNKVSRDRLTILETGGFFDRFAAKKGELETLKDYNKRIKKLDSDTAFYKAALAALQSQVDSTTTSFEKQDEKLRQQIDTFGLTGQALRDYGIMAELSAGKIGHLEAAKLLAHSKTLGQLEENAKREKEIDDQRQQDLKASQKEAEKLLKEQERTAQRFANSIGDGFVRAITGAESFKDAMKGVAKSVVDDLTRMIIKKMITDRIFGAMMNMPFFGGGGTPTASAGMTDFNPGFQPEMIAEGGGFTGYGARSGGVDGRGGFPAILHPNETVIDHTRGQGMGTVVNQTINISTGVSQTVRAEISNLMPQIQEATKAAVADSRARGGSYSKALLGV